MANEYEVIHHPQLKYLNLFLITVEYRTPHIHQDYELNYVLDGALQLGTGGKKYDVRAGDLILLNPNQTHELRATTMQGATLVCLQIPPRFFADTLPGAEHTFFDALLPFQPLSSQEQEETAACMIKLAILYFKKEAYYELLCNAQLNMLVYHLLCHVPNHNLSLEEKRKIQKQVERISRILEYVDNNYMHKIRLSDIAKQEGLTLNHLSFFVKDALNQTFQEYVNSVRYNQARKLLLSTDKRLLDICIESGFSDPRYLSQTFIRNEGMTPEEYRKKYDATTTQQNVHRSLHSSQRFYTVAETLNMLSIYISR